MLFSRRKSMASSMLVSSKAIVGMMIFFIFRSIYVWAPSASGGFRGSLAGFMEAGSSAPLLAVDPSDPIRPVLVIRIPAALPRIDEKNTAHDQKQHKTACKNPNEAGIHGDGNMTARACISSLHAITSRPHVKDW